MEVPCVLKLSTNSVFKFIIFFNDFSEHGSAIEIDLGVCEVLDLSHEVSDPLVAQLVRHLLPTKTKTINLWL